MRLTWHQGRPTELQGATSQLGLLWVHSLLAPFGEGSELQGDLILRKVLPQHMDALDNGRSFVKGTACLRVLNQEGGQTQRLVLVSRHYQRDAQAGMGPVRCTPVQPERCEAGDGRTRDHEVQFRSPMGRGFAGTDNLATELIYQAGACQVMRSDIEISCHKPLTHMCFQERGQAAKNLSIGRTM